MYAFALSDDVCLSQHKYVALHFKYASQTNSKNIFVLYIAANYKIFTVLNYSIVYRTNILTVAGGLIWVNVRLKYMSLRRNMHKFTSFV